VYAKKYVRTLERGPDYDIPMLRSILQRARGVIVHSRATRRSSRTKATPDGAVIRTGHGFPSGAGTVRRIDGYRARLGLDERAPLVGIFGYLKPYNAHLGIS